MNAPPCTCIYCGHQGPGAAFDNEHVFPRALCGTGNNWTLVDRVCKTCNGRFSKFEAELLHQSAEAIARAFSGPLGRSARSANGARIQPLKINHLYAQNPGDPLVFEAGFAFPSEFYFRPQMIDVGDGTLLSVITSQQEVSAFQTAVSRFVQGTKEITLPRPRSQADYDVVTFNQINGTWQPGTMQRLPKPSDIFFRDFSKGNRVPPMTARLAQNDDGKLFVRAADLSALGAFLDLIYSNNPARPRPPLPPGPGQTFVFGVQFNYIKVFKAVLKTGLNLVAHVFGDAALREAAFDRSRAILLENVETRDAAQICAFYPGFPTDFPRAAIDAHQLMLDEFQGALRFRMRLYNSFAYECTLANLSSPLRALIGSMLPKRVLVEYATAAGIHEVPTW